MFGRFPARRHVPHREIPGALVFLTWRLHHHQPALSGEERSSVLETIRGSDPQFASVLAAVVMDDHAHVLARPVQGVRARRVVLAWKGITAHRLCGPALRAPPLWQRAYFDRWLQDEERVEACVRYILNNPWRRWPTTTHYPWVYRR